MSIAQNLFKAKGLHRHFPFFVLLLQTPRGNLENIKSLDYVLTSECLLCHAIHMQKSNLPSSVIASK
jgi:hypothetical protein